MSAAPRALALVPAASFACHAGIHVGAGRAGNLLWSCMAADLLLAAGLALRCAPAVRVATLVQVTALPFWIGGTACRGLMTWESALTHIASPLAGLTALRWVRADHVAWRWAFAWWFALRALARVACDPALNVNLSQREWSAPWFPRFWQYWLATTALAAALLWLAGRALLVLVPPREPEAA